MSIQTINIQKTNVLENLNDHSKKSGVIDRNGVFYRDYTYKELIKLNNLTESTSEEEFKKTYYDHQTAVDMMVELYGYVRYIYHEDEDSELIGPSNMPITEEQFNKARRICFDNDESIYTIYNLRGDKPLIKAKIK